MLIGARDKTGMPSLISCDAEDDIFLNPRGEWTWKSGEDIFRCEVGDTAESACKGIPPGEKRVIDLEKSVIVHVAPPKTPGEELVEACEFMA